MPGSRGFTNGARYYTAVCVKKSSFQTDYWATETGAKGGPFLENRTASVVLSGQDGQTPLEAGSMEISAVEAEGTPVQGKNCTDCVEIGTAPLSSKAEGLKMEAWMEENNVRALGIAGLMWVAINAVAG